MPAMPAGLLGSEELKQELLPRLAKLEWTGAWALTEPSNGSDASALQSTAREVGLCCLLGHQSVMKLLDMGRLRPSADQGTQSTGCHVF